MRICSIEGCERAHVGRGWCAAHYRRWQLYRDPLGGGTPHTPRADACSVDGCTEPVLARGWCINHYGRWKRNGDPLGGKRSPGTLGAGTCKIGGCPGTADARGWCPKHYQRWQAHGDPLAHDHRLKTERIECAVASCTEESTIRGWCGRHYQRWRSYGDPEAPLRRARNGESTKRWLNQDGYILIRQQGRSIFEHRKVMEEKLGRKLLPGETVHHMNGVRTDNRPENLELWVSTRSGQRVADLIAFVVGRYRAEVEAALNT